MDGHQQPPKEDNFMEGGEEAPMEEPMAVANVEDTGKPQILLAVLASEDDDVYPFDKIVTSSAFQENEASKKFVIKTTTYESFLDGTKVDSFDFVLLTFMTAVSSDDLEMKEDYYSYYTQVPIVHYAVVKKGQDNDELKGVHKYLEGSCQKQLWKDTPLVFNDLSDTSACANALIQDLDGLMGLRNSIFNEKVLPAYSKFDKDGNGTIDLKELEQLLAELGQPVNEEQLEVAMKDLDLNGDGVVDQAEFSRWYFTGMKSYNSNTRSMLQMRNQTSTIFDILAKEDIMKLLHEDKTMTKHKVKIQFNEPVDAYHIEITVHPFGPFTEQMIQETNQFKQEMGAKIQEQLGNESSHIFFQMEIAMKPGQKAKYEEFSGKMMQLFDQAIKDLNQSKDMMLCPRMIPSDDKLTFQLYAYGKEAGGELAQNVPVGLREGLKDLEQYLKVKVILGTDAQEILTSEKPLFEHALKGFSAQVDVCFLKKIKKALEAGLKETPAGQMILQPLGMAGPAFSVGSNLNIDLTFDNLEEVKQHPMASQALMTLDQLLQGVIGKNRETIQNFTPDFSSVDQALLDAHITGSQYCKNLKIMLDMEMLWGEIIKDIDPDCKINIKVNNLDLVGIEANIAGPNYGELVHLIYNISTIKPMESQVDKIISDFKSTQEQESAQGDMAPAEGDMAPAEGDMAPAEGDMM